MKCIGETYPHFQKSYFDANARARDTLKRVANPDNIKLHRVDHCSDCGCSLKDIAAQEYESRQVLEKPADYIKRRIIASAQLAGQKVLSHPKLYLHSQKTGERYHRCSSSCFRRKFHGFSDYG